MVYKIGNRVTVAEPTLIWTIQRTSLLASPLYCNSIIFYYLQHRDHSYQLRWHD